VSLVGGQDVGVRPPVIVEPERTPVAQLEGPAPARPCRDLRPRTARDSLHGRCPVEAIFGIWAVALGIAVVGFFDWETFVAYLSHGVNFTEPMFVVVIMTLASTRPILKLSEALLGQVARLLGGTLSAWWFTILTLGPLLGSLITEPAAMTISE